MHRKFFQIFPLLLLGACASTRAARPIPQPPDTPKSAQTDRYHGVTVADPYRWLEDGQAPEVKAWSAAQNARARGWLDALPEWAPTQARVAEVMRRPQVAYGSLAAAGGKLFALKQAPPKQQPILVLLGSASAPEPSKPILDPNALDAAGTTHIDWYRPSPDGALVAVSLSKGGTESGDVHIYEVESGAERFESIPRVNGGTAGGDLAWWPDGAGFYYTRYPGPGERPEAELGFFQELYSHRLGEPASADKPLLQPNLRIAEIQIALDKESGRLLASVQEGDGGRYAHYLKEPGAEGWRQLSEFGDGILQLSFGPKERLYILSRRGAPRGEVLWAPVTANDLKAAATLVIPESADTIVEDFWSPPTVLPTEHGLYVLYQLGGPSTLRRFTLDGAPLPGPTLPPVTGVSPPMPYQGGLLLSLSSYLAPPAYLRFDPETNKTSPTAIKTDSPISTAGLSVLREFASSKDGTQIPVNIIQPAGLKKDGKSACVVYGYGGYGVNLTPSFRLRQIFMAERGVVYAIANIRGGGEYGEAWHKQGSLTHKQNVFDDFAAAIHHMIDAGYCRSARLGILGGSNGGLLMGATITQHPELMRAVVSYVGIYDMLRVELSKNGAFNVTEFGTVKDEAQFQALYAYSPYHRVKDGVPYPATLFLTGENDPRVDPMQSRKMTARLQAAVGARFGAAPSPGRDLILLRTSQDTGHGLGAGLSERIAQTADMLAFFFDQLQVPIPSKPQ